MLHTSLPNLIENITSLPIFRGFNRYRHLHISRLTVHCLNPSLSLILLIIHPHQKSLT